MEISVIIPVYNAEKYIDRCLTSLLAQHFPSFEIIFVNDGSSDDSRKMLMQYRGKGIPIRIIDKENGGQGSARNLGIEKACGEFLCFVDIDDYIHPDMLLRLYEKQKLTKADIVWCDAFKRKGESFCETLDKNVKWTGDEYKDYLLNNASPWRKLIRTSIIKDHNLYFPNIRFYEDIAVVGAYGLYAKHIAYVKEPLYYYDLHEGSTMHQKQYDKRLLCIFEALDYLRKQFAKPQQTEVYAKELEYLYIDHLLHAASLRFFAFRDKKSLEKIVKILQKIYPKWCKNRYYQQKRWKYKLLCFLFYKKHYGILKRILG
ncbi:MAG: glycosyltransferase family 2 protein [Breznakia sp.]